MHNTKEFKYYITAPFFIQNYVPKIECENCSSTLTEFYK